MLLFVDQLYILMTGAILVSLGAAYIGIMEVQNGTLVAIYCVVFTVAIFVLCQLASIVPVDLLIGGSPSNDFSLANPARKGFDSGMRIFFSILSLIYLLII